MYRNYNYIPETNHVSRVYNVAAILWLQFMVQQNFSLSTICTFTLLLSEVRVQCPIWLFSVVSWCRAFPLCCSGHEGIGGVELQIRTFLSSAVDGGKWWELHALATLILGQSLHHLWNRRQGEPETSLDTSENINISCPRRESNHEFFVFSMWTCHYTDRAIPAHIVTASRKITLVGKIQGDSYSFDIAESEYDNQILLSPTNVKWRGINFKTYVCNKKGSPLYWFVITIYEYTVK
jgi:hypothetical protein